MQYKYIQGFILSFLLQNIAGAQSVLYSSVVTNDINTRFEVIGKAGNFYWLNKIKRGEGTPSRAKDERSFEVYNERLNRVKEIASPLSDSVIKEYLIPQKAWFDQLLFKTSGKKTSVVVNRFAQNGAGAVRNAHLFDFPAQVALENLIVTRSPDRTKILLLGFVQDASVTPKLYARVYSDDWELLHETVYMEGNLVQPFIQYDLTEYVLESCDPSPVKITNNGDWLMVAPARFQNSFSLWHFKKQDGNLVQVDVQQPKNSNIEFLGLCVEENDAYVGILENITPFESRLRMVQYSLIDDHPGQDTAYSFHLPAFKHEEYQSQENFIQLPGKGFVYMKEYGRRYFINYAGDRIMLDNENAYAAYATHASKLKLSENQYTRTTDLSNPKNRFERGDLTIKYFPFDATDSCWDGLIHVEQVTELRYPGLSYACVSSRNKIIFLYNSLTTNEYKVSNSTILDHNGQPVDDGIIFWRSANVLNFQKARFIHPGELFVPFDRNSLKGFAIIRF